MIERWLNVIALGVCFTLAILAYTHVHDQSEQLNKCQQENVILSNMIYQAE